MKNGILVTGESGFIARSLANKISMFDDDVVYLSRTLSPSSFLLEGYDPKSVCNSIQNEIDTIIHIAAYIPEPENDDDYQKCLEVNFNYTQSLIELARLRGVGRFVFLSSFAIYDGLNCSAINEGVVPAPLTRYSQSKLAAEHLVLGSKQYFDDGVVVLRPAFTYGPYMKRERMIPYFIEQLRQNNPLEIYNSQAELALSYVGDVCDAIIASTKVQLVDKCLTVNLVNEILQKKEMIEEVYSAVESTSILKYLVGKKASVTSIDNSAFKSLLRRDELSHFRDKLHELL